MSIRSSSTIRKVAQVGEDKLVFRTQVTMSKLENMVAIWLFNRKIVQANDRFLVARTVIRSIQAGLLQANLLKNIMT